MPSPQRLHPSRRAQTRTALRVGAVIACLLSLSAAACAPSSGGRSTGAGSPNRDALQQHAAPGSAVSRLFDGAEREANRPVHRAMRAPTPPGVDAMRIAPIPDSDARARLTLAQAVDTLAPGQPAPPGAERDIPEEALRRFIAGRALRLNNDLAAAERELEAARRIDDASAEIWRELAEVQLRRGARNASIASFRAALERDPSDLRSLEVLGRVAYATRNFNDAAALLARAWRANPGAYDAGLPFVLASDFGLTLHELGYVRAGNEALSIAASVPDPFPSSTRYGRELSVTHRLRSDAWRDVGDGASRLGDFIGAMHAYERAAELPSLAGSTTLLPREVFVAMRLGSPSRAALAIVRDVDAAQGRVEDGRLLLLRHLAAYSDVGPVLAQALDEVEAALEPAQRRIAAGSLARARAAALDDSRAVDALRDYVANNPTDARAVEDLLSRLARSSRLAALRETIRIVAKAPSVERPLTGALMRAAPSTTELLGSWPRLPADEANSLAGALVRARLLSAMDAAEAARTLDSWAARSAHALALRVELLARIGEMDKADALLATLDANASDDARFAKAAALESMQRYAEALDTLKPLLAQTGEADTADPDHLFLGAALSRATGDDRAAERLLRRLVRLDPVREDAYAALLTIYMGPGPLADEARLNDTMRALREAIPSNKTLRLLRAREFVSRGQYEGAERDLLDLAEQDPSDAHIAELLVSVWIATGATERAEAWLMERIAARPDDGAPRVDLARVLTVTDRADDAATMLKDWLSRRPGDAAASRRLEDILRHALGRPDDADAIALTRLSRAPGVIDNALDIAQIRAARREDALAAQAIIDAIRPDAILRPEQAEKATATARTLLVRAGGSSGDPGSTLRLCAALAERLPSLPDDVHRARIRLMVSTGATLADVAGAADLGALQRPDTAVDLYLFTLDALREHARMPDASVFARHAALARRPARPSLVAAWILLGYNALDADTVAEAIRVAAADDQASTTQEAMSRMLDGRIGPGDGTPQDLAYTMGNAFAVTTNPAGGDVLYELTLEFDPAHPWANNNLGYRYTERGERLDDAYRMIRTAYEQMPDEAAIVDSYGWVLYRLGALEDRVDENGAAIEGAVSVLVRAVAMGIDDGQFIVLDHLGDALWASDRKKDAADLWEQAKRDAEKTLGGIPANQRTREANTFVAELLDTLESVRAKLDAAREGKEPPITPIMGDGRLPRFEGVRTPARDGPAT